MNDSDTKHYKSTTAMVIETIGLEKLKYIWMEHGHKKTAKIITEKLNYYVSRDVIRYIATRKFNWRRIVTDRSLSIYKAVEQGKVPGEYYRSIIFI